MSNYFYSFVKQNYSGNSFFGGTIKKLATIVEGDPKAPFSIATTPRCRGGRYSIIEVFALFFLYLWNQKSWRNIQTIVLPRYFFSTKLIIWRIIRICDIVDRFSRKLSWFFPKNFLDFSSNAIKKGIINQSCKSYASVAFNDSYVTFWGKRANTAFRSISSIIFCLYTAFHNCRSMSSTFIFHISGRISFTPVAFLSVTFPVQHQFISLQTVLICCFIGC